MKTLGLGLVVIVAVFGWLPGVATTIDEVEMGVGVVMDRRLFVQPDVQPELPLTAYHLPGFSEEVVYELDECLEWKPIPLVCNEVLQVCHAHLGRVCVKKRTILLKPSTRRERSLKCIEWRLRHQDNGCRGAVCTMAHHIPAPECIKYSFDPSVSAQDPPVSAYHVLGPSLFGGDVDGLPGTPA